MSLDSPAKRTNRVSPIHLLQPSYLYPDHKNSLASLQAAQSFREKPISPVNTNLSSWMLPYHSLDRAVMLHQASVRSRARHDLLNLQFQAKKDSYLSHSLVSLPKGNGGLGRGRREERQQGVEPGERRSIGFPSTLKYFNSTVIPDMRTRPVFLSEVNAYIAYLERKHFK